MAKLVTAKYGMSNVEVCYCNTLKYEHPDNARFLSEVSQWIRCPIKVLSTKVPEYLDEQGRPDIYRVYQTTRWLVGVQGARCTTELKKVVRKQYQQPDDIHCFGFTKEETSRRDTFVKHNPELYLEWPLIDAGIGKSDCLRMLREASIAIPMMYRLGYKNNNCIGCVKGYAGYWNKIRRDFPDIFAKMAQTERELNVSIIRKKVPGQKEKVRVFLDELDPTEGRYNDEPDIECGPQCVGLPT